MIIHKKLNNNVVIVLDDNNNELILTGKGISFNKSTGERVDEKLIEKQFTLIDKSNKNDFIDIFKNIPVEYILLADDLIKYASSELKCEFHDYIYPNIVDHIYMSVNRYLDGVHVPNILLDDIRRFYNNEYLCCLSIVDKINDSLKVELEKDEAGFLVFHFINAQKNGDSYELNKILKLVKEIVNIIKYETKVEMDEHSLYYQRLLTHIKFFSQRVLIGENNITTVNDSMYHLFVNQYKDSTLVVDKICMFLEKKYKYSATKDDRFYLIIHINTLLTKIN